MDAEEIPPDVRAFLRACIPSVGHMEALVLTMEEPSEVWTVESIARRLYVSEADVRRFLRDLAGAGLLEATGAPEHWRFAPADEDLADRARRARGLYRQRLVPMTRLIQSRQDAGTQLADAFRIRKE